MASMSLPPGFRFHPTDEELVRYYLRRKVLGKKFRFEAISELNIYKFSPWDLPDKSCLRSKDLEWYFFCPRERKYASGARMNRATETGYWKTTGKDRAVSHNGNNVGMIKTLVFHQGHAPKGNRTDWVIYEYRLEDKQLADAGIAQAAYVLCKVFCKNGLGPKNGAQYGAPFNEEEWDDDAEDCYGILPPGAPSHAATTAPMPPGKSSFSVVTSKSCPEVASAEIWPEMGPCFSGVPTNLDVPDDDITRLLASFTEDNVPPPDHNDNNEMLDNNNPNGSTSNVPCSEGTDFYHDLGDLGNWPEFGEGGISFTATQEVDYVPTTVPYSDAYMELNDLEIPLNSSALVNGSEHMQISTNLNGTHNISNVGRLYHEVNPFGINDYHSGSTDLTSLGVSSGVGFPCEMLQVPTNQSYNASNRLAFIEPHGSRGINRSCDETNRNQVYNAASSLAFTEPNASRGNDQSHGGGRIHK